MYKKLRLIAVLYCGLLPGLQAQLDDPTRPPGHRLITPGGKQAQSDHFWLSSVFISSQRKTATVNGRKVEVGDTVNGAKVVAILPSEVHLSRNEKIISVRLVPSTIKKSVKSTTK